MKIKIKKIKIINLILILISIYNTAISLGHLEQLFHLEGLNLEQLTQTRTFASQIEKEIEGLKKIKIEQIESYNLFKSEIDVVKEKLQEYSQDKSAFAAKYTMLLNQILTVLSELQHTHQQIINIIDSNIKLLNEFKSDPEFKNKALRLISKSIYSIEDLQKLRDLLLQYDSKISAIEEKLKKVSIDIDQIKKTVSLAKQEHEEKKKEQKELKTLPVQEQNENKTNIENQENSIIENNLTVNEKAKIIDEEEKYLNYKRELAEYKLKELEQKKHLFETELKTTKIQLEIIIDEYKKVKNDLCIDEKEIRKIDEELKNQIQELAKEQEATTKKISGLEIIKAQQFKKILDYRKKYKISEAKINSLKDWVFQPKKIDAWDYLIAIGRTYDYINYELNINKEEALGLIEYEKAKVYDKEIDYTIINTWYKLTTGKLNLYSQEDQLTKEIKIYEKYKTDIKANISTTTDRQSELISTLNNSNKIIDNIKICINNLKEQKDTVFKDNSSEYEKYLNELKEEAFEFEPKRNESITQLIELLNNINNIRKLDLKKIDIIIEELKNRSKSLGIPILLKGLKNFIPDIKKFFIFIFSKNITDVLSSLNKNYNYLINYYKTKTSDFILNLLYLFILIFIFILAKIYSQDIIYILNIISPKYGLGFIISNFILTTYKFIINNLTWILLWLISFYIIRYLFIVDNFSAIIFYLLSIIIFLLFTYNYINFLIKNNIENDYFIVSKDHQNRFFSVLSIILYSNIIIIFFKEAFALSPFFKSDVIITLQAIQIIIIQIGIVFMISKEQILKAIPTGNSFWQMLYDYIDNYYYIFSALIIFVIIMTNPYVGYGPRFLYLISRLGLIILLVPIVIALHNRIKRLSIAIFFTSEADGIQERFANARTFYSISVVLSFIFFIALAAFIALNLLGYNINLEKIAEWIHKEIYYYTDPDTGKHIAVSIIDLSNIVLWILAGIITSYVINKYILGRIFDLLLVNIGIQNAIISLVRYSVIITFFVIGLRSVGMGSVMIYILAILGGLGVAGKELITDFIGYFIILIQRPIKIGDFIRINDEVNGIVRHITLRSVILRRKNSVTVIVPNSQIMAKSVVNWNYSRSYFAFDDIFVTVSYGTNVEKAKELIEKAIENNINILKNPVPIVWLNNFTDNGYQFLVRGFISYDRVLEQWQIASDIRFAIVKILKDNNIEIASPVRTIKIVEKNSDNLI